MKCLALGSSTRTWSGNVARMRGRVGTGSEREVLHPPNEQRGLGAQLGRHFPGEPRQQRTGGQELLGHLGDAFAGLGAGLHGPVMLHHRVARAVLGSRGDQTLDEEVAVQDRALQRRTGHHPAEHLRRELVRRPEPGVAQDDAAHPLGALHRDRHADRPTPVLAHRQVAVQAEVVDELADHPGMLVDGVTEPRGSIRKPETEVIRRDAAEPVAQRDDDVAVQEAPGRVAVAQQDRRAVTLVDVVHASLRAVEPARLERIQLGVRGEIDAHAAPSVALTM